MSRNIHPLPRPERPLPRVLTCAEVAAVFGVDRTTVWRQARATGQFAGVPAIHLTSTRMVFSRAAIDRLVDGETAAAS